MGAPFLFCQKIVPLMKENKWGRIINYTTGTTKVIQPNLGAYVAAKNGINALTSILAREVGGDSNITVNCLVPDLWILICLIMELTNSQNHLKFHLLPSSKTYFHLKLSENLSIQED